MNELFAKMNFAAAGACFLIALMMVLTNTNPDYRISTFYLGMLCIGAGLFFRQGR